MSLTRRRGRWLSILAVGLVTSMSKPARADDFLDIAGGVVVGFIVADVTFIVYDSAVAAQGQLPSRGWSVAETIVAVPQVVGFQTLLGVADHDKEEDGIKSLMLLPAITTTTLMTHGIWSWTSDSVSPSMLFGLSPVIATDLTFTTLALANGVNGKFTSRPNGILQMMLTAPQIVAGGTVLGTQSDLRPTERVTWTALTVWSSILFAHGIGSAIWGSSDTFSDEPPPPPPPPHEKPPLLVPASIEVAPTIVSDGLASGFGLVAFGRF